MSPTTAIQLILGGLQIINTARRMFDPAGGDRIASGIISQAATGQISIEQAEQQLLARAQQRVSEEMSEWRALAPKS